MSTDQYQEVLIVIVAGVIVFIALVGAVVFTMLYYQKKKFQHFEEKRNMAETFNKQLLQSRLEMQEETFGNISQEIHDNVGQLLSLAKVQLNIVKQHDVVDKSLLDEIKTNIGQAMTDLRDIAKSLSNERLQLITLPQAVEQELYRISKGGLIRCSTALTGTEMPLPEQKKVILFRIIQESLQNILKHAKAKHVSIEFKFNECDMQVIVFDDGLGFDVEHVSQSGLGLRNITHRATLIGGKADIRSTIHKGTTITLKIPYV